MASVTRRFLNVSGTVVVVALALAAVGVVLLGLFGVARLVPVLSDSMAPGMPKGSLAITTPAAQADIRVGDVVVFTAPDGSARRVIHRVQHVYGPDEATSIRDWTPQRLYLQTGGDNNPAWDPWVVSIGDPVIWRQDAVVPMVGWVVIWAADPRIRIAVFVVGGLCIAAAVLRVIWRRAAAGEGRDAHA